MKKDSAFSISTEPKKSTIDDFLEKKKNKLENFVLVEQPEVKEKYEEI